METTCLAASYWELEHVSHCNKWRAFWGNIVKRINSLGRLQRLQQHHCWTQRRRRMIGDDLEVSNCNSNYRIMMISKKGQNSPLEIVLFYFMSSWFLCLFLPPLPTRLPERPSFKCKPTSDIVGARFVYGGWWLAAEMQDSLGTGPVRSSQALGDEMKQPFKAYPHRFALERQHGMRPGRRWRPWVCL